MLICEKIGLNHSKTILKGINLSLGEGEIIGIVGKSGAGKTSLLKILAGLIDPTEGNVYFEGKKLPISSAYLVPGHPDITLVNQDFDLDTYHTVAENIREKILYLPKIQRDKLVEELLELLELKEFASQKAFQISGGEQQRLAIARALAQEPKIILLDEPFVHLDGRLRYKLINYFLELRRIRKTSIILVSHDGSEILSLVDRIYIIKNGSFFRRGSPKNLYYKPKTIEEGMLFGEINSIKHNGKRVLFRPDEYQIVDDKKDEVIRIEFDHSLFTGSVLQNYFLTERKEKIALYSLAPIEHARFIRLVKR